MSGAFDVTSSATLLEKLVEGDQEAWDRFVALYGPMIETWGRRCSLPPHDVDDLRGNVLVKLLRGLPKFQYDPARRDAEGRRGGFRGWLKTIVMNEVSNLGRERARRPPGARGTGDSNVLELLAQHPQAVDSLVEGLRERSEGLLACLQRASEEVRAEYEGKDLRPFEAFRLTCLEGRPVKDVQAELGYPSFFAVTQAAYRVRKKIKERAWQLAEAGGWAESADT